MIYGHITQLREDSGTLPHLPAILDALDTLDLANRPTGRQTLLPGRADLIIDRYTPSPDRPVVWESHRKYADLQLMLAGEERFGWLPVATAPAVKAAYDADREACFYHPPAEDADPAPRYLPLTPGFFAVFMPHDIHAPGLVPLEDEPRPVVKAVVKIALAPPSST